MPAAHGIYKSLIEVQDKRIAALKAKKSKLLKKFTDHVFLPEYPNRDTMIAVAGRIFSAAVKRAGLETESEKHTLYSLRHTSIMYRLLLGTTSTLELARNARTSQAMIDKFYASRLTPLMSVESIHSFKDSPAPSKVPAKKSQRKRSKASLRLVRSNQGCRITTTISLEFGTGEYVNILDGDLRICSCSLSFIMRSPDFSVCRNAS